MIEKIENNDPLSQSANIVDQNIDQLKQLFPEVFKEGKIDWQELQATLGEHIDEENERFNFTWNGKSNARKEAQKPSTGTLRPCPEESVDWNSTENLYIEGDNLEVLKLLQKSYHQKVKMIYIDPPYNTGKDFVYKDNYKDNLNNYLELTGQKDEQGKLSTNSDASGRYHSNWLNMMYPRLKLARNLLQDDGVIFISIDDNEVDNLRKLCNEIFGEENFVAELVWKKRVSPANDSQWFSSDHEYIIVYAKNKNKWYPVRLERTAKQNSYYKNSDNDPRGAWNSAAYTCNKSKDERPNLYYPIINPNTNEEVWPKETAVWAYSKETHKKHVEENILYWGADGNSKSPRKKQFLTEAKRVVSRSFLEHSDVGSTQSATLDFLKLFEHNYFTYTKPVDLLKRLIKISGNKDDNNVILDFFSGSGTLALSLMELKEENNNKSKYVCIQLPEILDDKSQASKDGYRTIAEIGKERIRRAGKKLIEENPEKAKNIDLGFKVLKLDSSNIKTWSPNTDNLEQELFEAVENIKNDRTENDLLFEILLKYGLDLTAPITEHTIENAKVYSVGLGALIVCLSDKITVAVAEGIAKLKEELQPETCRVVFKDNGFTDSAEKTNVMQKLKQHQIEEVRSI
jgi:adenine-specific DNA-methyltransferase